MWNFLCGECWNSIKKWENFCKNCWAELVRKNEKEKIEKKSSKEETEVFQCWECWYTVKKWAKNCKNCWAELVWENEEPREISTNAKITNSWTTIVNFFRFLLFIIATALFSYLCLVLIWLLLGLFAMLSPFWLIVLIILFTGLFFAVRSFLIAWLAYLINQIFRIPVNKKLARIFFIIIFILMCIDKIAAIWILKTGTSTTFNVFYTLIIIVISAVLSTGLKDIIDEDI